MKANTKVSKVKVKPPTVTVAGMKPEPKNMPPQMLGPSSKSPVKKIPAKKSGK